MYTSVLAAMIVASLSGGAAPNTPEQEARAIIEKAVQALGGEKEAVKLQTMRMKAQGSLKINDAEATFSLEFIVHTPGRAKMDMDVTFGDAKINMIRVRNRDQGWETINGQMRAFKQRNADEILAWGQLFDVRGLLPLLKDKAYQLSPLGEIKVNDRPAVGVKAAAKGQTDIDLYFDKSSMLLVKSARWSYTLTEAEVNLEVFYSDYKKVDGIPQPWKHKLLHDGKKFIEMEMTEIRLVDRIDDEEFAKP